jgi:hypothetical protein
VFSMFLSSRAVPATPGECLGALAERLPETCGLRNSLRCSASPFLVHEATSEFAARYGPRLRSRRSADQPTCRSRFYWRPRDLTQGTALPYCSAIHRGGLLSSHKEHAASRRTRLTLSAWFEGPLREAPRHALAPRSFLAELVVTARSYLEAASLPSAPVAPCSTCHRRVTLLRPCGCILC